MTTTPTDYSKLTAAELAERIGVAMGWRRNPQCHRDGFVAFEVNGRQIHIGTKYYCWSSAECWQDAGELMDMMIANRQWPMIWYDNHGWNIGFPKGHSMMSKSFPRAVAEAVCAALEAKGTT